MGKHKRVTVWTVLIVVFLSTVLNINSQPVHAIDTSFELYFGEITYTSPKYTNSGKSAISMDSTTDGTKTSLVFKKDASTEITSAKTYNFVNNKFEENTALEGKVNYKLDFSLNVPAAINRNLVGYLVTYNDKVLGVCVYNPTQYEEDGVDAPKGLLLIDNLGALQTITGYLVDDVNSFNMVNFKKSVGWQTLLALGQKGVFDVAVASEDTTTVCNRLVSNWEIIKDDIRGAGPTHGLLSPAPGSEGNSQNENWVINSSNNAATVLSSADDLVHSWLPKIKSWISGSQYDPVYSAIEIKKLTLSTKGKTMVSDMANRYKIIGDDLDSLKNNSDDLSDCSKKLKKIKYDKTLETDANSYANIAEFQAAAQDAIDFAVASIENLEAPVVTGGDEGKCGAMSVGKMFAWALCNIAAAIESLADRILERAVIRFLDVTGVIDGTGS